MSLPYSQEVKPSADIVNMKFSSEEMRVLQECNKESFYKRCLPLSGFLSLATFSAIKAGYLQQSTRFGMYPKISVAVVMGFIIGKFSYRRECAEKLMQLPDSEIGNHLRKKFNRPSPTFDRPLTDIPFVSSTPQEQPNQLNSSLDLDTDSRPSFAPSEDSVYQSTKELSLNQPSDIISPAIPTMTYEDMRKQNRESYAQSRVQPYINRPEEQPRAAAKPQTKYENKNKYGDVID